MPDSQGPWNHPPDQPPPPRRRHGVWIAFAVVTFAAIAGLLALFPGRISTVEDWGWLTGNIGWLVLILASLLVGHRLKLKAAARYATGWGLVIGLIVLGYAYRDEMLAVALRMRSAVIPGYPAAGAAHEFTIGRDAGGAFEVVGAVNGKPVTFMIDTGASEVVLSPADARRIGVDVSGLKFSHRYETANGVGMGAPFTATRLGVGPIRLDNVPMSINQAPMSTSLLGMSFLRRLDSFEMRRDRLVLKWTG